MPGLTPGQRGVMVELAFHDLSRYTPSDPEILANCGALNDRTSVVRARTQLRAKGLIDWDGEPGRKVRQYTMLDLTTGGGPYLSLASHTSPAGDTSLASVKPVTGESPLPEPDADDSDPLDPCDRACDFLTPGVPCTRCGFIRRPP